MLNQQQIETIAKNAAHVAYKVLGLTCPYTVELINDPSINEDGLLDTQENRILLNLAKLEAFPPSSFVSPPEDEELDADYRLMLKTCYVVFHEMRHLYQKQAVLAYSIYKRLGGGFPLPESVKKCELWLSEMKEGGPGEDAEVREGELESDADDFAYYLTTGYPSVLPLYRTNRRIGAFKRKYDKEKVE